MYLICLQNIETLKNPEMFVVMRSMVAVLRRLLANTAGLHQTWKG